MAESDRKTVLRGPAGILRPSYEVYCPGCDCTVLGIAYTKATAVAELRRLGWRTRWGRWFCPRCYTPTQQERQVTTK